MTGFTDFVRALKTDFAEELSQLDGRQVLKGGPWHNLVINGQALLGEEKAPTSFHGLLVVNGVLKAVNCLFDRFHLRGSYTLRSSSLRGKGVCFGPGTFTQCTLHQGLELRCPGGTLRLIDSIVEGDLYYSTMGHRRGTLVLERVTLKGKIFTPTGEGKKVKVLDPLVPVAIEEVDDFQQE